MSTPLYDYRLIDDNGIRSVIAGIDIPPAEYAAKLAPYSLRITQWTQSGSIEADQSLQQVATISAAAIASQPAVKSHHIAAFVVGLLLSLLIEELFL